MKAYPKLRRLLGHSFAKTLMIAALLLYGVLYGGTWQGVISLRRDLLSVFILAVLLCGWGIYKVHNRTPFYPTVLDRVMPLWGIAFAVSTLSNLESFTLIREGLVFVLVYVVIWYVFNDLLVNKVISEKVLINALVLAGIPIVGLSLRELPDLGRYQRLYGVMDNPNTLGGFLVMLVPLLLYMLIHKRGLLRVIYGCYLVMATLCLLGTDSRGAWFGTLAALGMVGFMSTRSAFFRIVMLCLAVPIGIYLFNIRGDYGRFSIYHQAAVEFAASPIAGQGLFTFRRGNLSDSREEILPGGINIHAHNLALHVAAELGIVGLFALVATLVFLLHQAESIHSSLPLWAFATSVGVFTHQMVDFPVMMPGLMMCVLLVLVVSTCSFYYSAEGVKDDL